MQLLQQQNCCRSCIVIQVSEYLLNNYWVFDTGDYLDGTGTFVTNIRLLEGLLLADTCYTPAPESRDCLKPVSCYRIRANAAIHLVDICLTLLVLQIGLLQLK